MSLTVYIFELLVWPFFPPSSLFCFCFFKGETSKLSKAAVCFTSEGIALEGRDSLLAERMGTGGISRSASDSAQCKNYEEIYVVIDQDHINPDLEMALKKSIDSDKGRWATQDPRGAIDSDHKSVSVFIWVVHTDVSQMFMIDKGTAYVL
ncbi:hypothetical protein PILCRDRAFT_88921 [Piloderma croceum F 1598]|uniref:Uncharacterized protein n=1 Tax=Piloderma croceum (strain F 1598) TaxID=765440 RepID=A0A0C3FPV8_PILCF|nr:hypothetical protein PILCRDRAFT_88921 [Piloderma croceum F 1598]